MEISYRESNCFLLDPFNLSLRHLRVGLSSGDFAAKKDLWNRGIITYAPEQEGLSLFNRVKHITFAVLECIPAVGLIVAIVDRWLNKCESFPPHLDQHSKTAIIQTPQFASYGFEANRKVHLTNLNHRPLNLLLQAIFQNDPTTQPGSGKLFDFPAEISFSSLPAQVYEVSARGKMGIDHTRGERATVNLAHFYGDKTYRISTSEIHAMHASQHVWVSSLIPKPFYIGMKQALGKDGIVALPANDRYCSTLEQIRLAAYQVPDGEAIQRSPNNKSLYFFKQFLIAVQENPAAFGFTSANWTFNDLEKLTLYQVGSMVLKTEDYRAIVGDGYKIKERQVGQRDAIRLISASGIRGFRKTPRVPGNESHQIDQQIMKATFQTALRAAGSHSHIVMPAVGMGVWRGDPDIYWRALFDAVKDSAHQVEWIYINPGHQTTLSGRWSGSRGEEFAQILDEYHNTYPENENLKKIISLFDRRTDIFLLAQKLKNAHPETTIALFNASDPDVTLGDHVGEYVNNLCHASTTEENYAAAGTSGLGFERFTGVLADPNRIHQG